MSSACLINWTPPEVNDGPHDHVRDLLQYMDFVFLSKSSPIFPLPHKTITAMHFTSCSRISASLLNSFYDCAAFNSLAAFNFLSGHKSRQSICRARWRPRSHRMLSRGGADGRSADQRKHRGHIRHQHACAGLSASAYVSPFRVACQVSRAARYKALAIEISWQS